MAEKKREGLRLNFAERRTLLVFGDLLVSIISLILSLLTWATISDEWLGLSLAFFQERVAVWFYLLPLVWILLMIDMYNISQALNWRRTIYGVSSSTGIGLLLYLVIYFASQNPLPRVSVAIFLVLTYLFTLIWRYIYIRIFTTQRFLQRVLVVGAGKAGETILEGFNLLATKPFNLIGLIDDDPDKLDTEVYGYWVMASSERLLEIVESEKISDIIVAISGELKGSTFQTLLDVQQQGVQISRMPVVYEQLLDRVPINILEADWLLRSFVDQFQSNRFFIVGKRILDIIGGIWGVVFLTLIFPFVGLAIILEDGKPIFYSQVRLGVRGEKFNIIKFRTMGKDAEANGIPLLAMEDDERATRVGRFLRKTHVDEIPQFINVLKGELSLVGPRSERPELVEHYLRRIPFYRARLLVKPGITGWAQVNYGYAGDIEETRIKLEYDLYYIKNRTIILDILTIIKTPGMMFGMRVSETGPHQMSYHTNVDWDKFLKKFPNAHLLQTRPWGEVKAAFGWEATWVATEAAGAQLLFQPLPFGFTWGYIARGPVGYPDEDFWQLIEAECCRRRAVFLKIEPDLAEIGEIPESHWPPNDRFRISHHSIQPRRTLSVNLDGEEEDILERMKQKTRYNIRLSDRKGVKVRHSDDITGFYKLLQVTGQRDEFGIHTEVYYQTVFNAFTSTDSCALILAEFEDSLLSAAMVFAQGERSWYLYGASSNQHRNIMAPYAVQWEAIRWARSKGCRQYDLWGVPDKDIEHLETEFMNRSDGLWGVYRFKRGFGGTLKRTVGSWDIVFNPVLYSFYLQWVKKHAT